MSNEDIKMSECCTCGTKWRTGQDGSHSCTRAMALRIKELEAALCEISNMCIGNLTMSYSIDPDYVGQLIYQATGMTNPELNESVKEQSK